MCGIVGYAGRERCVEVLMEGLGHLEYRGYDSAGLALQRDGRIEQIREVGRLGEPHPRPCRAQRGPLPAADRGGTHPLGDARASQRGERASPPRRKRERRRRTQRHHRELRGAQGGVGGAGRCFRSETDTEVMAHLLPRGSRPGRRCGTALAGVLQRLEGSFAVAAISVDEPGKVVAASHQSPLVVGLGEGENFLASAVHALLGETHEFLVVENGEIVEITDSSVEVFTTSGEPVERESLRGGLGRRGRRARRLRRLHAQGDRRAAGRPRRDPPRPHRLGRCRRSL